RASGAPGADRAARRGGPGGPARRAVSLAQRRLPGLRAIPGAAVAGPEQEDPGRAAQGARVWSRAAAAHRRPDLRGRLALLSPLLPDHVRAASFDPVP